MQGHWVWPNITDTGSYLYSGAAGQGGQFYVSRIVKSSDATNTTTLGTREIDDHNVPAIIKMPNSKMLAVYSRHGVASVQYLRISASNDSDDWGSETTLATTGFATYAQLAIVGSRIWLAYRVADGGSGHWVTRYSDDNAATWSAEVNITSIPYLIMRLVGSVWRCHMYEHPITGTDHDIYTFQINLSTGAVSDDNGNTLGNVLTDTGLPVTQAECHKVADVTGSTTTRLYDVAYDGTACLASEFVDSSAGTYYRYTYSTGTGLYTKSAICTSGPAFYIGTSNYFGSVCFDEASNNTVYAARNLGPSVGLGNWVLEKYTTSDGGASWQKVATIRRSTDIICRPQHKGGRLWWSEITDYPAFTAFRGNLRYVKT